MRCEYVRTVRRIGVRRRAEPVLAVPALPRQCLEDGIPEQTVPYQSVRLLCQRKCRRLRNHPTMSRQFHEGLGITKTVFEKNARRSHLRAVGESQRRTRRNRRRRFLVESRVRSLWENERRKIVVTCRVRWRKQQEDQRRLRRNNNLAPDRYDRAPILLPKFSLRAVLLIIILNHYMIMFKRTIVSSPLPSNRRRCISKISRCRHLKCRRRRRHSSIQ